MASPKRKPYCYMCGTPREHCGGAPSTMNAMLKGGAISKSHLSPQEAFACHRNYLVNVLGYTCPADSRALHAPNDGPVRVLTKASRFGSKMRNGKEGTRNMPHIRGHRGGARGGTITSL